MLLYQLSKPPVYELARKPGTDVFRPRTQEHPEDETFTGLLLIQPEGRIFFANAQKVAEQILPLVERAKPKALVLDLSQVYDLEYTALKMLIEAEERHRNNGVVLCLAGLNPRTLEMVRRSSLGLTLGNKRMCFNVNQALSRYLNGDLTLAS